MARRDIKAIQDVLKKLAVGNKVKATFSQQPYGEFTIEGPVARNIDNSAWRLGGWLLNMGAVPAKALQSIEITDDMPFLDENFFNGGESTGQTD